MNGGDDSIHCERDLEIGLVGNFFVERGDCGIERYFCGGVIRVFVGGLNAVVQKREVFTPFFDGPAFGLGSRVHGHPARDYCAEDRLKRLRPTSNHDRFDASTHKQV